MNQVLRFRSIPINVELHEERLCGKGFGVYYLVQWCGGVCRYLLTNQPLLTQRRGHRFDEGLLYSCMMGGWRRVGKHTMYIVLQSPAALASNLSPLGSDKAAIPVGAKKIYPAQP